ncbi:MAG: polyprenyl synthetase family protein [Eubacterium sp.]|nr:polyprenyl synthetase family protein [Eubacterium sp.]
MNITELTDKVNNIVQQYVPAPEGPSEIVAEAMAYAMSSGGKRIRPLIMYLVYKSLAGEAKSDAAAASSVDAASADEEVLRRFMSAIEMIHTSSLIHDDLPALDNDSLRRGMPTVHVKYREDAAILAGDALMNLAYETAVSALDENPGSAAIGSALSVLIKKTGMQGMLGGQSADVMLSGKAITEEERDFIYEKKTSALIEAPFMIGAILAGAEASDVEKLETAGRDLGLAFQVRDDILDIISDAETLGKEVGQDEKNNKSTYAAVYGVEAAENYVNAKTASVLGILDSVITTPDREEAVLLKELVEKLAGRNS